jgi:hypothetical protein
MYRHDYILRLIQQLGAALITLRDRILRRQRDETAVRAEIGEIARQAGLDVDVARSLDPQQLLLWLAPVGEPDPAKLWLMAELLYLEGLETRAAGGSEWIGDFDRALAVLAHLPRDWRPDSPFASAGERIDEMRALLDPAGR